MLYNRSLIRFSSNFRRWISTKSDVKVDVLSGEDRGILVVRMDRESGKNSLSRSFVDSLENTFRAVYYDKDVRAVVLKSDVPKIFCAGADLKERLKMNNTDVEMFVDKLRSLMVLIENVPVPVVAAINGAALGGGLEMALACDIRVASENSKIGLVETKLAIIPGAGGTQRLTRIIGVAKAKELIYTAKILNGKQAFDLGVVNHCVDSGEDSAFHKALDVAREILPNGPIGVKMAKKAINKGSEVDLMSGFAIEGLCYAQVVPTKDRIEALEAFQQKRKPIFTGS